MQNETYFKPSVTSFHIFLDSFSACSSIRRTIFLLIGSLRVSTKGSGGCNAKKGWNLILPLDFCSFFSSQPEIGTEHERRVQKIKKKLTPSVHLASIRPFHSPVTVKKGFLSLGANTSADIRCFFPP